MTIFKKPEVNYRTGLPYWGYESTVSGGRKPGSLTKRSLGAPKPSIERDNSESGLRKRLGEAGTLMEAAFLRDEAAVKARERSERLKKTGLRGMLEEDRMANREPKKKDPLQLRSTDFFKKEIAEIERRLLWYDRGVVTKEELDRYDKAFGELPTTPGWKGRVKEAQLKPWERDVKEEVRIKYALEDAELAESEALSNSRKKKRAALLERGES